VSVQGTPTTLFLSVGSPNARAQVPIITTFSNNGAPVTGARVEVQLVGSKSTTPITLNLYDDGQHDDGQANDGVYGVVTGSLAPDDYEVIAQGNALGTTRLTLGSVQVTATGHTVYLPFVSVSR